MSAMKSTSKPEPESDSDATAKTQCKKKKRRLRRRIILALLIVTLVLGGMFLNQAVHTLSTLEKIDDYPLYVMHYHGDYDFYIWIQRLFPVIFGADRTNTKSQACSLFVAQGDSTPGVYGRNFDWTFSPVLVLFTEPSDGYASISIVDIAYLGFDRSDCGHLPGWGRRLRLMPSVCMPFEGMNNRGLTVAIASLADTERTIDPKKKDLHQVVAMRKMLDSCCNLEEALALLEEYNIVFTPGPAVHYLIADALGKSAVVEFTEKGMEVIRPEHPWQVATNSYLAGASPECRNACWRYKKADQALAKSQGSITTKQAMDILKDISNRGTQWSAVFDIATGCVLVSVGRNYDRVHEFQLKMQLPKNP